MRSCPACNTQYSDDTLSFCLQDGAPLLAPTETDTPTVVLGETETFVRGRVNVPVNDTSSAPWQDSQVTHIASTAPANKGSKAMVIVLLAALGTLLILGIVGFAGFVFYKSSQQNAAVNNSNLPNLPTNTNYNGFPTPLGSPVSTPGSVVPNPTGTQPPVTIDKEQVARDVTQKVFSWKSQTESKDFNGLRASYAGTLDYYYTKRNVSANSVLADKQRAFRDYDSLRINLSNMSVTTDPSGETATATYNKDWTFNGAKPFCGAIRSQMRLRKINGVWLITGEKDVPGTFRRTC